MWSSRHVIHSLPGAILAVGLGLRIGVLWRLEEREIG
jgi:hypothetical protein